MTLSKRLKALESRYLTPDEPIRPIFIQVQPADGSPRVEMHYAELNRQTIERLDSESEQAFLDRVDTDHIQPLIAIAQGQKAPSIPIVLFSGKDYQPDMSRTTNARPAP